MLSKKSQATFQEKYELFKVFITNLWTAPTISVQIQYAYMRLSMCGRERWCVRKSLYSMGTWAHPIIVNHTILFLYQLFWGHLIMYSLPIICLVWFFIKTTYRAYTLENWGNLYFQQFSFPILLRHYLNQNLQNATIYTTIIQSSKTRGKKSIIYIYIYITDIKSRLG